MILKNSNNIPVEERNDWTAFSRCICSSVLTLNAMPMHTITRLITPKVLWSFSKRTLSSELVMKRQPTLSVQNIVFYLHISHICFNYLLPNSFRSISSTDNQINQQKSNGWFFIYCNELKNWNCNKFWWEIVNGFHIQYIHGASKK